MGTNADTPNVRGMTPQERSTCPCPLCPFPNPGRSHRTIHPRDQLTSFRGGGHPKPLSPSRHLSVHTNEAPPTLRESYPSAPLRCPAVRHLRGPRPLRPRRAVARAPASGPCEGGGGIGPPGDEFFQSTRHGLPKGCRGREMAVGRLFAGGGMAVIHFPVPCLAPPGAPTATDPPPLGLTGGGGL